jgi:hypothetical protein
MPRKKSPRGQTTRKEAPIYVAPSRIHGRGLFAARDIPADTLILRIQGRAAKRDGPHVIWPADGAKGGGFLVTNEARYVNHADKPNAAFYDMELWSVRRIREGEEITHDYSGGTT